MPAALSDTGHLSPAGGLEHTGVNKPLAWGATALDLHGEVAKEAPEEGPQYMWQEGQGGRVVGSEVDPARMASPNLGGCMPGSPPRPQQRPGPASSGSDQPECAVAWAGGPEMPGPSRRSGKSAQWRS